MRIGVEGWSALLAAVDLQRERELRATLARDTLAPSDAFTETALVQAAVGGAQGNDLRWLSTIAIAMTPVPIRVDEPALAAGIKQLFEAGLVTPQGEEHGFTARGEELAFILRTLMAAGALGASRIGRPPSLSGHHSAEALKKAPSMGLKPGP